MCVALFANKFHIHLYTFYECARSVLFLPFFLLCTFEFPLYGPNNDATDPPN